VALINIPPYVLADEDPPTNTASVRAFHLRAYQLVEPIEFPRALFGDALAEHARLVVTHGAEILAAPLDHAGNPADHRFVALEDLHEFSSLLVSDGATHEVHRWTSVDLSYVVQRCRGIVRRLMEVPPRGLGYVVVVAGGVASLQLVRGVAPLRVGEGCRLEVVERDLVVEPWDQWHLRDGWFVRTWWRTPIGELAASRARVRAWPSNAREVTDAVLTIRGTSVRERIDAYVRENPRGRPLAIVETSVVGEEIEVVDRRGGDAFVDPFAEIVEALRVARTGLDPVVVYAYHWAALCWIAAPGQSDVALPEPLVVARSPRPDDEDEDEDEDGAGKEGESGAKPEPRIRLSGEGYLLALFDHFPPLDPWEARAGEVHAAWRAGLLVAVFAVWLLFAIGALWFDSGRQSVVSAPAAVLAAVSVCGCALAGRLLRSRLRAIDPARRRYRWRAWKQVTDELEGAARPPKPKPAARGRKFWMRRLAERLARLERLVGLDAPENIVDYERKLVRDAIAELEKGDADAVLTAWPAAVKHLEPRAARRAKKNGGGRDEPN
jgi:hypothetical protein